MTPVGEARLLQELELSRAERATSLSEVFDIEFDELETTLQSQKVFRIATGGSVCVDVSAIGWALYCQLSEQFIFSFDQALELVYLDDQQRH